MTDINLLRWRKKDRALSKNQLKISSVLSVGLAIIFIGLHFFLGSENSQSRQEWRELNDHIAQSASNTGEDILLQEKIRSEISQQKLSRVFNVLNCLGDHQVQADKMQFQDKKSHLSGWVDSPGFLSNALKICLGRGKNFSLKKIHFSHGQYNMPVHFSFDIV